MKMIATQTVKIGGKYVAPGSEFDADSDTAKSLTDIGAASRKTREVADDSDDAPAGPASGQTVAPDPNEIGREAKTAKR